MSPVSPASLYSAHLFHISDLISAPIASCQSPRNSASRISDREKGLYWRWEIALMCLFKGLDGLQYDHHGQTALHTSLSTGVCVLYCCTPSNNCPLCSAGSDSQWSTSRVTQTSALVFYSEGCVVVECVDDESDVSAWPTVWLNASIVGVCVNSSRTPIPRAPFAKI